MTILAKGGRKYKRRKRKGAEIRGRQKLKGLRYHLHKVNKLMNSFSYVDRIDIHQYATLGSYKDRFVISMPYHSYV